MLEKWTNTSSPPSREMKPKPFSALKNFTVPVVKRLLFSLDARTLVATRPLDRIRAEARTRHRAPRRPLWQHGEVSGGRVDVVVVGGGHNGLAMSKQLADRGFDHVVLEQHEVADSWRNQRWDSFTLLTPSWQ